MKPPKLLLLSVSLAVAAAATQAEILERVVARVNGDVVTLSEFEARQLAAVQQGRVAPAQIETFLRENNARLLQEAIDDMLILQRGAELGIKLRPEYIQEVIDGIKKENNIADDAELQRQLRREGMSLDDLKRNIERSIVRRQVLSRELEAKATVNEAEARSEYERDQAAHTRRASVHLHEIVAPDEEQARALVGRARAGEDFAALARAHSTAASRDAGGDLGVLHRGEMNAAVEAVAFALPDGGVSDPLPTDGGYRILRVAEKKEGSVASFDEVKDEIVKRLSPGTRHPRVRRLRGGAPQERGDPDHGHRGPAAAEPARRGHGNHVAAIRRGHHRRPGGPGGGVRRHAAVPPRARGAAGAAGRHRAVPVARSRHPRPEAWAGRTSLRASTRRSGPSRAAASRPTDRSRRSSACRGAPARSAGRCARCRRP